MTPPVVRINTLFPDKTDINLDRISKVFIIVESLFGINRLPVFGNVKPVFVMLSIIFSLFVNFIIIYLAYINFKPTFIDYVKLVKLWQYIMCALLGLAFWKKLNNFFWELHKFDKETGFRCINNEVIKNLLKISLTVGFITIFFVTLNTIEVFQHYSIDLIIILVIHIGELQFFGHLLTLLVPRLRLIHHLMKSNFSNRAEIATVENDFVCISSTPHPPDIKKLMDFYHRLIIAFDSLYEAIKWQILIILITSFVSSLSLSFHITLNYIRDDYLVIKILVDVTLAAIEIVPMFAPCRVADVVHDEAQCVMELLSCRLYENKIDKSDRAVAQAMLALMEVRDLSFSLLRVFDLDISFPFKFLGLLVTYLIILLQFDKVIKLDRPT